MHSLILKTITMNKYKKIIATLFISLFLSVSGLMAQSTAPSNPPDGPGTGDDPIGGGGAPISGQTVVLFSMALAYIGIKTYKYYRKTHIDSKETK